MVRAGSPADPTFSSTWVFSHACSAGWSWRSLPPLIAPEHCSSLASTRRWQMHEPSRPIWRRCATASGWFTANEPFGGPEEVLRYLARYTHRVAISSSRLLSLDNGCVTFRWRDSRHGNQTKSMTLEAVEFIRRFLLHILPPGFIKIRHFGFLANRNRSSALALCRQHLNASSPTDVRIPAAASPCPCLPYCERPVQ